MLYYVMQATERNSMYTEAIRTAAPTEDPRHVEGYMRLKFGTLDALSATEFNREARAAAKDVAVDRELAEANAQSFGL